MQINQSMEDGIIIYTLDGKMLGGPDSNKLLEMIHQQIESEHMQFIVDLENVKWVNSSGLGVLINILNVARQNSAALIIIHASDQVVKMMKITRLDRIFRITDNLESAKSLILNPPAN
ncbi:MAG: STAS domain-containing protein [Candidatus Delongbacteria bacterium]|nr:STAS domain-containing protein [Candidatus Delongbacteria bacterium]